MKEETKEKLRKYIEKEGLSSARKLTGLPFHKLVSETGVKINPSIANTLILEYLGSGTLPQKYKEFDILGDITFEDNVRWIYYGDTDYFGNNFDERMEAFATPFYDGDPVTPVDTYFYTLNTATRNIFDTDTGGGYAAYFLIDKNGKKTHYDSRKNIDKDLFTFNNIEELLMWYKNHYLPTIYDYLKYDCLPNIRKEYKSFVMDSIARLDL